MAEIRFAQEAGFNLVKEVIGVQVILGKKYLGAVATPIAEKLIFQLTGKKTAFADFIGITAPREEVIELTLNDDSEFKREQFEKLLLGIYRLLKDSLAQDSEKALQEIKHLASAITADSESADALVRSAIAKHHDDVEALLEK